MVVQLMTLLLMMMMVVMMISRMDYANLMVELEDLRIFSV
jgi:hypothetical protein